MSVPFSATWAASAAHQAKRYTGTSRDSKHLERHEFDQDYLDRLCAGDAQTELHFCQYFGQLLGVKLRSRLRSPQAAEDVRQETFARVFTILRRDKGVRHPERIGALVNSVCNNVLLESYRSSYRDSAASSELPESMPSPEQSPFDQVEQANRRRLVREILAKMPERERSILTALFLEEADKDEICRRFNVDRNYLRVLVFRAKQVFRQKLIAA